ncbi:transposable element Tcb2 transposase [Trichonephila clavipes]|nr:transposable element Tcb2 transposase [Trichonephila clavipes]
MAFVCNGLMSAETGKLIDTKLSFSDESRFNFGDHNGCICIRRYAGERCLPECFIERYSDLTPGVKQDNASPNASKTVRDVCSNRHVQLLPWPAYSPDMLSIEPMWDFIGRRLARGPRPAASKDELLLRIQAIWNSSPEADIQNLFDSMPRRIAAVIAARETTVLSRKHGSPDNSATPLQVENSKCRLVEGLAFSVNEKMPENDEDVNSEGTVQTPKISHSEGLKPTETTLQYFEQQGASTMDLLFLRHLRNESAKRIRYYGRE